ncbi:hypothetical protein WM40_00915 [Robbsia andropogonis]|uniref:Uncharacterized protein n=1 Tax=Robbsia andropogonis TaxID=28092 RepID=A0A0F5K555_9BURK|nr:hypothetical protein WM40_00915 [Robbsia andropogonis]
MRPLLRYGPGHDGYGGVAPPRGRVPPRGSVGSSQWVPKLSPSLLPRPLAHRCPPGPREMHRMRPASTHGLPLGSRSFRPVPRASPYRVTGMPIARRPARTGSRLPADVRRARERRHARRSPSIARCRSVCRSA